ncbi:Putative two component sensor serine/threonine kinase [Plesiocystis pacifica SIR-1]|uniref:Putative two component sensor serine/threonine kinase n=2 Tax=Plesiocystis pacifica TaxID=191768 RepID=A6G3D3_9BACT|nr:Putative two component sensor serine/threonine kinase [Plesiocystis pacifica SIR-1]
METRTVVLLGFSDECDRDFLAAHVKWLHGVLKGNEETYYALVNYETRDVFERLASNLNLKFIDFETPEQELELLRKMENCVKTTANSDSADANRKIKRFPRGIRPDAKITYQKLWARLCEAEENAKADGISQEQEQEFSARIRELKRDIATLVSQWRQEPLAPNVELGSIYKLVEIIDGGGDFSTVWKALRGDQPVALKVLNTEHYRDASIIRDFRKSAELLKHVGNNGGAANLVALVERYDEPLSGYWLYAMRHYPEGDLKAAIQNNRLRLREIIDVCKDVGQALIYLHERRIYHLDVNPPNILLDRDTSGRWVGYLADIDIAQELNERTKRQGLIGKFPFIAPELHRPGTERRDPRRDVFSLAATIVCCVNGNPPGLHSEAGLAAAIAKSPVHLRAALTKGCASDPDKRFPSIREFLDALDNSTPEKMLDAVLADNEANQGKLFVSSSDTGRSTQLDACAYAFTAADAVGDIWDAPFEAIAERVKEAPGADFSAQFLGIVHTFRRAAYREGASSVTPESAIVEFVGALRGLSQRLVVADASSDLLVFSQFILGLGFCEAMMYVSARFVDQLGNTATSYITRMGMNALDSYVKGLHDAFTVHGKIVSYLRVWFRAKRRSEVWGEIDEFWHKKSGAPLREAILHTVSFRPFDVGRPQTIILGQVMHWEGWGGTGEFFRSYVATYSRSPICRFLTENVEHTFDWHQKEQSDSSVNFSHRKNFFASAAVKAGDYAAGCAAVLICAELGRPGPTTNVVRIWGDAVGPKRVAEGRLMENIWLYRQRRSDESPLIFDVTVTDGSWPSLKSVETLEPRTQLYRENRTVLWRDLNLAFPGEPRKPGNRWTPAPNSFDCYSCAFSLHQVADRFTQQERITAILAFATRIVRSGGVLCIPDVGFGRFLQVFLLPTNVVDREGGWGGDVFSLTNPGSTTDDHRWRRFVDVASTDDEYGSYIEPGLDDSRAVKVPLPLLNLARGTPNFLYQKGLEIYKTTPYLVVSMSLRELYALDESWLKAMREDEDNTTTGRMRTDARARVINERLTAWSPAARDIVAEVPSKVWELGYELAVSDG